MGAAGRRSYSTVNVDHDQLAQARAAVRLVAKVSGRDYRLATFVREAFTRQLRSIWDEYNEGRPIAPDPAPLAARDGDGGHGE